MAACLLALGANLGASRATIEQALERLDAHAAITLQSRSQVVATQPIGGPAGQAEFVNAVAMVETSLAPQQLLSELQSIEQQFGRERHERWAARSLDLDVLLIDDMVIDSPELTLPHPRMSFRPFVLDPAIEIAADWYHPLLQATLGELHRRLHHGDDAAVVYGGQEEDRRWHAEQMAATFGGLPIERGPAGEYLLLCRHAQATASPKLAIQLRAGNQPPREGIPTLALPAAAREDVLFDTVAAIECVWPDLARKPVDG